MIRRRDICGVAGSAAFLSLLGCGGGDGGSTDPAPGTVVRDFSFARDAEGWTSDFTDLPANPPSSYGLVFSYAALPPALAPGRSGLYIAGSNFSDDLFMFVKRHITDLPANTRYAVRFDIQIASMGLLDGAGSTLFLKAGGSVVEPVPVVVQVGGEGYLQLNIDKGNQAIDGRDMINLGLAGSGGGSAYAFKSLDNRSTPFFITTDSAGSFWAAVGTDRGLKSETRFTTPRSA